MSTNEVIGSVTMLVAIIGFIFSCYQWWKKVQSERAEKLLNLINVLRKDVAQLNVLYKIDYGESWYSRDFHNKKTGTESEIDRLLASYEYILYLKKNCIILKKEFHFFEYDIIRIVRNYDTCAYLFNLYHFSKRNHTKFVYEHILTFGIDNNCIDKSFFDKNSNEYPHYI